MEKLMRVFVILSFQVACAIGQVLTRLKEWIHVNQLIALGEHQERGNFIKTRAFQDNIFCRSGLFENLALFSKLELILKDRYYARKSLYEHKLISREIDFLPNLYIKWNTHRVLITS